MAWLVWLRLRHSRLVRASAVRDFVVFESKAKLPAATAIYRIVRV